MGKREEHIMRRGVKFDPDDNKVANICDGNDRRETSYLAGLINANRTKKNITKERRERQQKSYSNAENIAKRIEELENEISVLEKVLFENLSKTANEKDVETAISENKSDLDKLIKASNELYTRTLHSGRGEVYRYNKLITNLAKQCDAKFILYANFNLRIDVGASEVVKYLDAESRQKLQAKLEEANLFERKQTAFARAVLRYFPDYIEIMDIDDTIYALTLDPSKFDKINAKTLSFLNTNIDAFKNLINKNSEILLYVPHDCLDKLVQNAYSSLGNAIVKNPNVLSNFYPSFFEKHYKSIKYMFSGITKSKVIDAVSPWIGKFPELATYFKINTNSNLVSI